jgi:hypothetical protein
VVDIGLSGTTGIRREEILFYWLVCCKLFIVLNGFDGNIFFKIMCLFTLRGDCTEQIIACF